MKKQILAVTALMLIAINTDAQWTSAGGNNIKTDPALSIDKVGIGMDPIEKLTVNGNVIAIGTLHSSGTISTAGDLSFPRTTDAPRYIKGTTPNYSLNLWSNNNNTDGSGIRLFGATGSISPGSIQLISNYNNTCATCYGWDFLGYNTSTSTWLSAVKIKNNGDLEAKRNIFAEGDLYTAAELKFPRTVDAARYIRGTSPNYSLNIWSNNDNTNGSGIRLFSQGSNISPGGIQLISNYNNSGLTNVGWDFLGYNTNTASWESAVKIYNDGQVVIGNVPTVSTNDYKLYVQTGILTEKLKVANSSDPLNWADFVFEDDYQLPGIYEVEKFIKANKHLPEIPTAGDVAKDGIDVAEMDAKLLQKIEELTLYVIQQQKEIDMLKSKSNK